MKVSVNPAQLIEHELNASSRIIEERLRDMYSQAGNEVTEEMEEYLFAFISYVNPSQAETMESIYNTMKVSDKDKFWNDILFGDIGIMLHQPPFYGNIELMELYEMYNAFDIHLPKKFVDIENQLILGDVYYMVLKHHPKTKFSARSSQYTNLKDIPSKSMRYRDNLQPYQTTPIRLGKFLLSINFINCLGTPNM